MFPSGGRWCGTGFPGSGPAPPHELPAVDNEFLAREVRGLLTHQEFQGVGHSLRAADPPLRNLGPILFVHPVTAARGADREGLQVRREGRPGQPGEPSAPPEESPRPLLVPPGPLFPTAAIRSITPAPSATSRLAGFSPRFLLFAAICTIPLAGTGVPRSGRFLVALLTPTQKRVVSSHLKRYGVCSALSELFADGSAPRWAAC